MNFTPRAHVVRDGEGWKVDGSDPCFNCTLDGNVISGGWYECVIELHPTEGELIDPVIYPDYGVGPSEHTAIPLPFVAESSLRSLGIVRLLAPPRSMRLDPTCGAGTFVLGKGSLRQVSKAKAAITMLRAAMQVPQESWSERFRIIRTVLGRLLAGGPRHMADWLYWHYKLIGSSQRRLNLNYHSWIALYDRPALEREFTGRPLISIVLPVYNTSEIWLRKCIDSVIAQRYQEWQLCICDDASPKLHVRQVLKEYAESDARIIICRRDTNGHISRASNDAVSLATGKYIALLDHDDELHQDALYEVVGYLEDNPGTQLVFTDEDKIDQHGKRYDPYFKPDWNPDLLLGHNCISHLGVYSADLVREVGGFRVGMEGSQDWDLALRCVEKLQPEQIGHVARVLYHWRAIPGSTALAPQEKNYAHTAGINAINAHLARRGLSAECCEIPGRSGNYRVRYRYDKEPSVSIIIPTRDQAELLRKCIDSIIDTTDYIAFEIIVVDNQSREPKALAYLDRLRETPRVRVITYDAPFNYSAINNMAAARANGELLVLMNNDIEVVSAEWLTELASNAMRAEVGAVGAMLYYPNDTIQHAGVLLGVHGVAAHPYSGKPKGWAGQMNRAGLAQNYTAVTAACLAVKKRLYEEVGGLTEELKVAFNDVDFCLKLREKGYWNVWLPWVELYHHESATRGYDTTPEKRARFQLEEQWMLKRWPSWIRQDPAYNRNLSSNGDPFTLAFPPRSNANIDKRMHP